MIPKALEAEAGLLPLNLTPKRVGKADVTLKVEDLHERLFKPVPAEYLDLLEIAAYVYCADQATSRGGKDPNTFGEHWHREFVFKIPVRVPDFWNRPAVKSLLRETLEFLSDDDFDFEFVKADNPASMNQYFQTELFQEPEIEIERVVMFSGGLDSLAGAEEESIAAKRRVMLVTHKPTNKLNNVHRHLKAALAAKAGEFKPEFISKLNMCQNVVNDVLNHPDDKPSIGLLLVKSKNRTVVEYSLAGYTNPIGIANWERKINENLPESIKANLPSIEEIEKEFQDEN